MKQIQPFQKHWLQLTSIVVCRLNTDPKLVNTDPTLGYHGVRVSHHGVCVSYHEVRVTNTDPALENNFLHVLNKLP